ncbi:MAG: DUF805 domain-containing protein [Pseudomonadota bacterium]
MGSTIVDWIKNKFFIGTDTRIEFWKKLLIVIIISGLSVIPFVLFKGHESLEDVPSIVTGLYYIAGIIMFLMVPLISLKRLNDLNTNKWFALLWFIPYVGNLLIIYCGFFPSKKLNKN